MRGEKAKNVSDDEKYKVGTTVSEIYALYTFDRRLRNIFLNYVLIFETSIKNTIAYYFSEAHPEENYLIYTNFNTQISNATRKISELISSVQKQISDRNADPCITHYLRKHGHLPLWVLNSILTLGTVSKFYSVMKQPERQKVALEYNVAENELESALYYLSKIRNICAHGNRLYCFRTKAPIFDSVIHTRMNINRSADNEFIQGKRDLFAALIIFSHLFPKKDMQSIVKRINHELYILQGKLTVLDENDILNVMGFPTNWKNELLKAINEN